MKHTLKILYFLLYSACIVMRTHASHHTLQDGYASAPLFIQPGDTITNNFSDSYGEFAILYTVCIDQKGLFAVKPVWGLTKKTKEFSECIPTGQNNFIKPLISIYKGVREVGEQKAQLHHVTLQSPGLITLPNPQVGDIVTVTYQKITSEKMPHIYQTDTGRIYKDARGRLFLSVTSRFDETTNPISYTYAPTGIMRLPVESAQEEKNKNKSIKSLEQRLNELQQRSS